jgi:hypothetical protein
MRIYLRTDVRPIKAGVEARVPELRLTTHGEDRQEALQRLEKAILTWCFTLQRTDHLERALRRQGVRWEPVDNVGIEISLDTTAA